MPFREVFFPEALTEWIKTRINKTCACLKKDVEKTLSYNIESRSNKSDYKTVLASSTKQKRKTLKQCLVLCYS